MAGMQVDLGALRQHEAGVRRLAGQLDQAAGAAGEAQALGSGAFGLVGQVIADAVQGWITESTNAVRTIAETGHTVADGIRNTHVVIADNERYCTELMNVTGEGL